MVKDNNSIIKQTFTCPYCGGEAKLFGRKDLRSYKCDYCSRFIIEEKVIKKEEVI